MGILQRMLAGLQNIVSSFSAWDVLSDAAPGVSTTATLFVNSNGSVTATATPNNFITPGSSSWFVPNSAGVGNPYFVRFTPTSGTLSTNTASSFTALSSNQSCSKTSTAGAVSATVTIDIATDAGGTNIVFTSAGNLVRNSHT